MKNGLTTLTNAFENVSVDSIPPSPIPKRSRPNSLKRKGTFESDDGNKRLATGLSMYFSESLQIESPISSYDTIDTLNNRAEQILDHLRSSSIPSVSEFRPWMDSQLVFYQKDLHTNSSLWLLSSVDKSYLMTEINAFKCQLWKFILNLLHQVNEKCQSYSWDQMVSDDDVIDHILLLFQSLTDFVELLGLGIPMDFVDSLLPCAIFFSHYSVKSLDYLVSKSLVSDVRILQLVDHFTHLLDEMRIIWGGNKVVSSQLEANCTEFGLGVCEHIGSLKKADTKNLSRIHLLLSAIARYIRSLAVLGDIKEDDLKIISKFIDSEETLAS